MIDGGLFSGLANWLFAGILSIIAIVIIAAYSIFNFLFVENTYESKKLLKPDMVIESKSVNGVQKSDTTYVYHLK